MLLTKHKGKRGISQLLPPRCALADDPNQYIIYTASGWDNRSKRVVGEITETCDQTSYESNFDDSQTHT